jgi:hypothetical protein
MRRAPSGAKRRAIAAPKPDEAPVMKTTRGEVEPGIIARISHEIAGEASR